jgi:kynureninase
VKEALRGRFSSDEEVIGMVQNWLKSQPKELFSAGIKKLVKQWNKCIEIKGNYFEK